MLATVPVDTPAPAASPSVAPATGPVIGTSVLGERLSRAAAPGAADGPGTMVLGRQLARTGLGVWPLLALATALLAAGAASRRAGQRQS